MQGSSGRAAGWVAGGRGREEKNPFIYYEDRAARKSATFCSSPATTAGWKYASCPHINAMYTDMTWRHAGRHAYEDIYTESAIMHALIYFGIYIMQDNLHRLLYACRSQARELTTMKTCMATREVSRNMQQLLASTR